MKTKTTHQVEGGGQDGGVRDGARLAAVEQELEALHALANGAQVDHVLVLHGFLAGSQALLETVRSWRERGMEGGDTKKNTRKRESRAGEDSFFPLSFKITSVTMHTRLHEATSPSTALEKEKMKKK